MIDPGHPRLSIVRQCELVSISRASFYRRPAGDTPENLELMRLIDEAFLEAPWYGARQMARHLRRLGWCVGRKRVRRLMQKIGLSPIYQAPKTSAPHPRNKIYPYLLRHLAIERPNQVWCADVMCGRPGRCKKNLFDLYEACSGAAMCPASDAAVHMPRARMESGDQVQITGTRSIALTVSLVFLTPSYRRCAIPVL